jgi:predicted GNAT family acetyltransferase
MEFKYEADRIYAEDRLGRIVAEITFTISQGIANIDHTFVDDSLRGQGIAGKLVQAAADQIIEDGHKITATCSYAHHWFTRHTDYQHALHIKNE